MPPLVWPVGQYFRCFRPTDPPTDRPRESGRSLYNFVVQFCKLKTSTVTPFFIAAIDRGAENRTFHRRNFRSSVFLALWEDVLLPEVVWPAGGHGGQAGMTGSPRPASRPAPGGESVRIFKVANEHGYPNFLLRQPIEGPKHYFSPKQRKYG